MISNTAKPMRASPGILARTSGKEAFYFYKDLQSWQNVGLSSWAVLPSPRDRLPEGDANTEKNRAKGRRGDKFLMTACVSAQFLMCL